MLTKLIAALVSSGALSPLIDALCDRILRKLAPLLAGTNDQISTVSGWVATQGFKGVALRQLVRAILVDFAEDEPRIAEALKQGDAYLNAVMDGIDEGEAKYLLGMVRNAVTRAAIDQLPS